MTRRLTLVALAAGEPMGQQIYEHELTSRAAEQLGSTWDVHRMVVRTVRSPVAGTVRVPSRVLHGGGAGLRRVTGHLLYRGSDLVHRLDLRLPPAPAPEALTILDLAPWRFADEAPVPDDAAASARRAAAVICPSQYIADEVTSVLGVRQPVVIPCGVGRQFVDARPLDAADLEALGIRPPFVLHVGGSGSRKNLQGLADAWRLVGADRPDITLVLIGPPDRRRDECFLQLSGTRLPGWLPDDTVPRLMASAAVLVVPSRYEGFGLPALEGMATGTPVVAAGRAALPEVCGDAAYLVEPDGPGLAEGIVAALDGGPETEAMVTRGRKRAADATWEAAVAAHARVWHSLGD